MSDLRARLERAAETLATIAAAPVSESERTRITGKREGVLLAISYIDEEARTNWLADVDESLNKVANLRGLFDT